jgi:hypothetical protein
MTPTTTISLREVDLVARLEATSAQDASRSFARQPRGPLPSRPPSTRLDSPTSKADGDRINHWPNRRPSRHAQRSAALPDVPAAQVVGLRDFLVEGRFRLRAPPNTLGADEIAKAVVGGFAVQGVLPVASDAESMSRHYRRRTRSLRQSDQCGRHKGPISCRPTPTEIPPAPRPLSRVTARRYDMNSEGATIRSERRICCTRLPPSTIRSTRSGEALGAYCTPLPPPFVRIALKLANQ